MAETLTMRIAGSLTLTKPWLGCWSLAILRDSKLAQSDDIKPVDILVAQLAHVVVRALQAFLY